MNDFAKLAVEIHADCVAAGWWNKYPIKEARNFEARMLVVSELSEAMEGDRKSLMDDHLPEHKMFDVELADAAIRLLDWIGALEIEFDFDFEDICFRIEHFMGSNKTVVEQLDFCCQQLYEHGVEACLKSVIAVAEYNETDLLKMIQLKRQYNATRADHKLANREKENGKKY